MTKYFEVRDVELDAMAVIFKSQKDLREVQDLPFCYLCGQSFGFSEDRSRDHVPPSGLFARQDRGLPLILPTHPQCNHERSPEDQIIGQLVGVLHGQRVNPRHNKLRVSVGRFEDGSPAAALRDLDIRKIIRRWIRGFHAALYREYLPADAGFATYSPLPEGKDDGQQVTFVPIPEVFAKFVEELKRNRAVRALDQIISRNGKCRYECVWSQLDDGRWICVYGLDLYDWIELGDINNFTPRGCVGCYQRPTAGVPARASTATRLIFDWKSASPYDPFAD